MSSGRARSPCDTDPRELRLDVICRDTLAAASRRNDDSRGDRRVHNAPDRHSSGQQRRSTFLSG